MSNFGPMPIGHSPGHSFEGDIFDVGRIIHPEVNNLIHLLVDFLASEPTSLQNASP